MSLLHTQSKSEQFMIRLPERMKEEIMRMAAMDGISINSAILKRLARCLREERV
ncbi:Arc family DNA-binding protein [Rouxiella badensis]|jgi:predicted HicB family RNase H-like nuclease|uniref:Arc family DNA-binding protein n=1 Tax=Rouxiella badensis TaxID=1646377 RepID=A0A1X0WAE9_9GAMM|nr:Arc family DNA-binding protein [Rouxiella badensis]MCC3703606.1 Arc family DNA-binding protein [Rouxiella badensis]MCC3719210.1 Arc family DNA-binding protein [Rouxiella badensis]MCC3728460.1 Arc family DNA-binding protein [Rouxiella badensis]MCC3734454.1 Arc family DNA-binding protein [Rouxiella badensis]MCC3742736.1 Arc family DNA-binding protein [Rouxiella badensis]